MDSPIDIGKQIYDAIELVSSKVQGNVFIAHSQEDCSRCTACKFEMTWNNINLVKELQSKGLQLNTSLIRENLRIVHEVSPRSDKSELSLD